MALPDHGLRTRNRPTLHTRVGWSAVALSLLLLFLGSGCVDLRSGEAEVQGIGKIGIPAVPKSGGNAIEVFNEMHFQPSYRVQEGPRILPPPDSVPRTGKELVYASLEEYRTLTVPQHVRDGFDQEVAQQLYRVNCQVCHGVNLDGSGQFRDFKPRDPLPADLTSEITSVSTDGDLFAFISCGGRQGCALILRGTASRSPMPQFGLLLSEEERWMLVMFLRSKQ